MERATKNFNGVICYVGEHRVHDEDIPAEMTTEAVRDVLKRLADYEVAEEQGRLVVLPNKIGDHVFLAHRGTVEELEIENITCNVFYTKNVENGFQDVDIYPNEFGRCVFQTREQAEKALEAKDD